MTYSQFTFQKVRHELGIIDHVGNLFSDVPLISPSAWLLETLSEGASLSLFSEKSRSEAIVFPILLETWKRNNKSFSIYSGPDLEADKEKGLSGECDFVLSKGEQKLEIDAPLFCMVEAKDQDMKKAIPQCIAQMEGARIFNEKEGNSLTCIYGCVTTGEIWQFLKLENKVAWIDTKRYNLVKLEELLGALQVVIDFYSSTENESLS